MKALTKRPTRGHRCRAFTLIELLTVIAIIGILAALIVPTVGKMREQSRRASAVSQLHQIGLAIPLYAGDHGGRLPGPLQAGQGPQFDPARPDQLATALGSYLGVADLTQRTLLPVLIPPAFISAMDVTDLADTHSYVAVIQFRQNGKTIRPWGDDKSSPPAKPLLLSQLEGRSIALIDADQQNPLVRNQPFASKTPAVPIHGQRRLRLAFDASVGSISEADIPLAGGGTAPPPPPPPPPPAS